MARRYTYSHSAAKKNGTVKIVATKKGSLLDRFLARHEDAAKAKKRKTK